MADIVSPPFAVGSDQQYVGPKIWMAFPIDDLSYPIPHDGMAEGDAGAQPKPFATIIAACASDRSTPIAGVTASNACKRAQKAAMAER